MNLDLGGKIVLVTGGSKGLGLACAALFLDEGAKVVIASRNSANLTEARQQLGNDRDTARLYNLAGDFSDPLQAERAVEKVEREIGSISILINSAGAAQRRIPAELDAAAWKEAMDAKFFPYVHAQDAVLRRMHARAIESGQTGKTAPEREIGTIVNIVGIGGKTPSETHIAGSSANAALLISTIGLAQYYAKFGIRINAVNPGQTLTGRVDQSIALDAQRDGIDKAEALERAQARAPLRRFGLPEEVANLVAFLASARASYIVGALISVDGGQKATI